MMKATIELGKVTPDAQPIKQERADAAANRLLLMETAVALFATHGVAAVSMADIAQTAGVGKGTLYRRFANKAELCLALMDSQMITFQNEVLANMRQMAAQGHPPLTQLDYFLDALVYFTASHMPLLCEVQSAGLLANDRDLQMPHFWQHMTVSGLMRTAVAEGTLSAELDIDYLADALLAPLRTDLFTFQRELRGFSLERISAGLHSMAKGLAGI